MEVQTTKANKLKLDELIKLDTESKRRLTKQIYINICLFFLTLLFGFFTLGVALLLEGPNFLTSLPYPGYDCDAEDAIADYCNLDKDAGTVFIDSLYYTVVSMSTVGYGDIYPKPGGWARLLGAVFILFGTLMLVRLFDIIGSYMIWKRNFEKKTKDLGKCLTRSSEFFEFDINDDGVVSKYEFLRGMLQKLDLVETDRIDEIMAIFNATDTNGDGVVDEQELKTKIQEDSMKLKWGEDAWKEIKREWGIIEDKQKEMKQEKKDLEKEVKELRKEKEQFEKEKSNWDKQKKREMNKMRKQIRDDLKKEQEGRSKMIEEQEMAEVRTEIVYSEQTEQLSDLETDKKDKGDIQIPIEDDADFELVLEDENQDKDKQNDQGYAD